MASTKLELFQKRRMRVRNRLKAVNEGKLRLSVHRSNKNISAQIIDDARGVTLAAASTMEKDLGIANGATVEAASRIGALVAERAKAAGISEVYFDRGGFLFHGKVKALADAARENGLTI
jgi:large subunit ribosomal protein L18